MLRLVRSVGLVRAQGFAPSATAQRLLANKAGSKDELDDDSFELLPPGASMKDPLYGLRCGGGLGAPGWALGHQVRGRAGRAARQPALTQFI